MRTMLRLILDASGSMTGKEEDVIGGVNRFISDQQKLEDESMLSMMRFNTNFDVFRPLMPLRQVQLLSRGEYTPGGNTALLDAIGRSLNEIDSAWWKHTPGRVIVVIATDGRENASQQFTLSRIRSMIEERETSGYWSFIYLGADPRTFDDARSLGIPTHNTASYTDTGIGTRAMYNAASASVMNMRTTGTLDANLGGAIPEQSDNIASIQTLEQFSKSELARRKAQGDPSVTTEPPKTAA